MRKFHVLLSACAIAALACGGTIVVTPTLSIDAIVSQTVAAYTVEAALTQAAAPTEPIPTQTASPTLPSPTLPSPTESPTLTASPTPQENAPNPLPAWECPQQRRMLQLRQWTGHTAGCPM